MSKIKLTGENSGYVEISAGQNAGNNTLETPTSGTRLVAHGGSQDVTLNANLTVNGVLTYDDVTNIDSVGVITARNGLRVTGDAVISHTGANPLDLYKYGTTAPTILMYGANGTEASPTQTLTGDVIGGLNMFGYGSSGWAGGPSVRINAIASENNGQTSNRGADIKFETVATGGTSLQERLRITSDGKISQGGHTPSYEYDLRGTGQQTILVGSENAGGAALILDGDSNGDGSGSDYASILHSVDGNIEINNRKNASIIFKNTSSETERLRITSSGQIEHQAASGDNQFISKRTNVTSSSGDYFFHLKAQNNSPVNVGYLGFHRDTANDDSRFVVATRNAGGSATERLRIDSTGDVRFAGTNLTNNTNKNVNLTAPSYNTSEEDVNLVQVENESGFNQISFGGGTSALNAATRLRFLTASTVNTTTGTERLLIDSDGQATFDKGAPGGANQVIARFQAESSRRLDIVWHDSGSLLGFDLPGSHSYIFKTAGTERLRINSTGVVTFGGQSYARASKSGGVNVNSSCYFDITGSSFVFVKIMIKVGYTGNASYQMHAQYDYATCNYYTTGSTATRTDILQVEAANAQFNYGDISISRPSNRTVRVTYAPSSGAGTHHPILYVSGVFDSITVS